MKITSVAGPGQVQDLSTPEHVRTANMKAQFIAKVSGTSQTPAPQEYPVANANNISAEEVSAIKPTSQTPETRDTLATETPVETVEPPKDPEAERKFAQIARQERQLRAKIQQANIHLKQREEALKAREAALTAPAAPDLSEYVPRSRLQQDALSVLEEAGISWDELTNQVVNRQPTDPRVMSTIQKLEAKIAQLEESGKTQAKSMEEREKANYQAAVHQIRTDVKNLVASDPEFETVKAMKAEKDVVELIERAYAKDRTVLTAEEASRQVEEYLVEEGYKFTQLSSVKKRMAAANASQPKPEEKTPQTQQRQPMKTLTNATASAQKISARERAIARGNGFTGDF